MSWLGGIFTPSTPHFLPDHKHDTGFRPNTPQPEHEHVRAQTESMEEEEDMRAPYWHCMLAGGLGGSSGDMLMHSIDTVKTRQQGDRITPTRYPTLSSAYRTILLQEGLPRGLYAGVTPAFLGSFPGTVIFFGTYEWSKRNLIDRGVNPTFAYLAGGFFADLVASVVYVPSEVLKTRLQLQGRYNNPFTQSGYNYRGMTDAVKTIVRSEGMSALFYGYKATIFRDLPFSALQFAFYEQEQEWARRYKGSRDIGIGLEIATAASAGGLAGTITCPFDVVKTRIQTQVNPVEEVRTGSGYQSAANMATGQTRGIATTIAGASGPRLTTVGMDTSSVLTGLRLMYRTEGMMGLFRGVGPRAVWTSVQSGIMLFMYQVLLRKMAVHPLFTGDGAGVA